MPLTKAQLIGEIYKAFEGVALEEGVGLWEGLALDDRLEGTTAYEQLKAKDERNDWKKIPILRLYECSSSLSFFDAKGMRFHLGLFLLFALDVFLEEEDELHEDKNFKLSPPEVHFALTHNLESDYSKSRFSVLSKPQIECVVQFLEYLIKAKDAQFEQYGASYAAKLHKDFKELQEAITLWKIKALVH